MSKEVTEEPNIILSLQHVPLFSELDDQVLEKIARICTTVTLARGEQLIAQGEEASDFFILIHGRLTVFSDDTPIAEVAPGEPIGEMAFFSGGTRSASVFAARRSEALVVTREKYDRLVKELPDLPGEIIRTLAKRVMSSNNRPTQLNPRAGTIIGVFPASSDVLDENFVHQLQLALQDQSRWRVLKGEDAPQDGDILGWIRSQEDTVRRLVLLCKNPDEEKAWAESIVETSDLTVLVADTSKDAASADHVSDLEKRIFDKVLKTNLHLVLTRSQKNTRPTNSAAWLEGRPVGLHHHVVIDQDEDFERIARFLRGEAVGLIFCGGGALGTAHIGMTKALFENGFVFDMFGGTSMGAAIGAAHAMCLSPDEVMDLCEDLFVRNRAMKRLTAPTYSVIDHRFFDQQLKSYYQGYDIEDLPLNFYAVATSLTYNDLSVQRTGSLWRAVRASSAIPGAFPPMVTDDGEVLIDGALMDNAPLETMRTLKPGRNVVMNLTRPAEWRVHTKYDTLPGRLGALRKLVLGKGVRFPRMGSVLARAMIANAEQKITRTDPKRDIIVEMASLQGMGFLEWHKGRRQFERAYENMSSALDAGKQKGLSGTDLLVDAAQQFSEGRATAWGHR